MKPILFNTEMVQGVDAGIKTVTRRVVKPQPKGRLVPELPSSCWPGYFGEENTPRVVRPPYLVGDILYVRETWATPYGGEYRYRADYKDHDIVAADRGNVSISANMVRWRPSIHMPKEAARLFLRVTDVRVERLQDILDEPPGPECQIVKEGCKYTCDFLAIWNSTIKRADRAIYGWEANPWVWVIEFKRITKEEAEHG